ncbi:MAG: hypothetical protein ABJA74_01735 [Lapillicoccus sp.]
MLAEELMKQIFGVHGVPAVVHADRGTSMTSNTVASLLSDLGVTRSHSRPHVSNDNPYSEALFKTMKYLPTFLERFGSLADARLLSETVLAGRSERSCAVASRRPATRRCSPWCRPPNPRTGRPPTSSRSSDARSSRPSCRARQRRLMWVA